MRGREAEAAVLLVLAPRKLGAPLHEVIRPCRCGHFGQLCNPPVRTRAARQRGGSVSNQQGYHRERNEGTAFWFLDTLMHVKAGATDTRGAFTLIEVLAPTGFGTPLHLHHREEEGFYVLEGSMKVQCGDDSWEAGPGSFHLLPSGVPHAYVITSGPCRMLQVTSPSQFEDFAAEVGRPATSPTLPEPSPPNMEVLLAASARYGNEILGPPLQP